MLNQQLGSPHDSFQAALNIQWWIQQYESLNIATDMTAGVSKLYIEITLVIDRLLQRFPESIFEYLAHVLHNPSVDEGT